MKLYHELAEYYFAIENNHRDIAQDAAFLTGLLAGKTSPALLDLGCGTGEHLGLLAKAGVRCTGIDVSEEMILTARRRLPEGIDLFRSDMQDISFKNAFDAIICLFGSFNYLIFDADIEAMLGRVRAALKPGGVCVFEIWNSPPIKKIREKDVSPVSLTEYKGKNIRRERGFRMRDDTGRTVVEVTYRYTIEEEGTRTIVRDRHVMRTFTPGEFSRFLAGAGFTVTNIFANFLSEPYEENSNRMVVVFEKR
jgi:SAM-dependent methyltransferase